MTKKNALAIARNLALPLQVAADSLAIIARKGRGKTYAASVLAEELLDRGVQIVVLDPMGAWWGLRSSADGRRDGYPVIIMGGDNGDVSLQPTSGKVVADFVLTRGHSVILDLSLFESRADEVRFASQFMDRLYRGKKKATGTIYLLVDEASTFAPQNFSTKTDGGDVARMVGAAENIARRGRLKGLGSGWIDQRAASVNKNVLTQAAGLLILGLTGTTDRKAIADWVTQKGTEEELKEMLGELPGLPVGSGYAWWPASDIFQRVNVRKRRTFDSSAAPEIGVEVKMPRKWTSVELQAVEKDMAETIERQRADDPTELRKQIAALRRELAEAQREQPEPAPVEMPVPFLDDELAAELEAAVDGLRTTLTGMGDAQLVLAKVEQMMRDGLSEARELVSGSAPPPRRLPAAAPPSRTSPPRLTDDDLQAARERPSGPVQRILNALAWLEVAQIAPASRIQVAMVSNYHPRTKGFTNGLGTARTSGLVEYPADGMVALTTAGRSLALPPDAPATDDALQQMIFAQVGNSRARILKEVIDVYPNPITRADLAERLSYHERTKGFTNGLGSLRTLGLIAYPRPGEVVATSLLFVR